LVLSAGSSDLSVRIDPLNSVIDRLSHLRHTVAFAESCTSGLVSATLGAVPGISSVFQGAIVSYANSSKEDLLDVPPGLLKTFGAVSEQVAAKMAESVRARLRATWGVSITGIAGPSGGTEMKPVGTVCFAVAGPELGEGLSETVTTTLQLKGNRREVQEQAVQSALNLLLDQLLLVS
jgi:PncC family amidohydrolase